MNESAGNTYYFALLRTIIDDLKASGRKSFAAGLKPRLQSLSNGEFAEGRLGFPTFKAFLEAAERAGVVELQRTPSDLLVLPRDSKGDGGGDRAPASREPVAPGKRIRPDLWRAWIEWSQALKRYYDRSTDTVVFLVDSPNSVPATEPDDARRRVLEDPERFLEIPPVSVKATLEAMRAFAETWPNPTDREAMERALTLPEPERAAAEFTRLLRFRPPVAGAWHLTRMRQVAAAIEEWAQRNQIDVNYVVDAPRSRQDLPVEPRLPRFNEDELRSRLVLAVQRMPVADLLRLPIPTEFLLDL